MPRLLVKKREEVVAEYVFKKNKIKVFIGSQKGNDVVLFDKNISQQHCTILFEGDHYFIKDQNTITGTQLNYRTISESPLNFGDVILIGQYNILFLDDISADKYDISAPQYYLVGIYGKFYGKKYFLKQQGDTFIGRENLSPRGIDNDIVLSGDMTVSKGHAKINSAKGMYTITDVGSTGGVAVNGTKLGQLNTTQLMLGDEVSIGRTIFRVVDYYNENYSLPAKQNIFLLKLLKILSLLFLLIIFAFSISCIYIGYSGKSTLSSNSGKVDLTINSNWSQSIPLRPISPVYNIVASPLIDDFDGDGKNDIAMLSSSGFLYVWNGITGDRFWKPVEIYNSGIASLVSDDVNNDGIADIVAVSDSSLIYIIDGQSGNIIRREILGGVISELTPLICDLDGDGKKDIVVASEDGTIHMLYSPGFDSSYTKYSEFIDGPIYASPIILSRKDFSPFIVIANYNSKVYFIDGKTRNKKTINLVEATGKAHLIAGAPAVGDIDGDGIDEVVVQSNVPQYVSAIDTTKFTVKWTYFVEPTPPSGIKFNASPIITDLTGNGIADVLIVSANGSIQAIKGKTTFPSGELLYKLSIPEAKRIISSPAAFDFDKDGITDIIFGTEDGRIIIAKSNTKRKEMEILADIKASNSPITSTPLLADINGDKNIEVLYVNAQDSIQMLNTNVRTIKNLRIWPMFLANAQHTSSFSIEGYKAKFNNMIYIGIIVLILYCFFKIRSVVSKSRKRVKVTYL